MQESLKLVLKFSLSLVLLFLTFWLGMSSNRSLSTPPKQLLELSSLENKSLLIGLVCENKTLLYNKLFLTMLGLELSQLNISPESISVFCFKSYSSSYQFPKIDSLYALRYLNKPTFIVEFKLVNTSSKECIVETKELGNINLYELVIPSQLSLEAKKYCIAQLVYNLTVTRLSQKI